MSKNNRYDLGKILRSHQGPHRENPELQTLILSSRYLTYSPDTAKRGKPGHASNRVPLRFLRRGSSRPASECIGPQVPFVQNQFEEIALKFASRPGQSLPSDQRRLQPRKMAGAAGAIARRGSANHQNSFTCKIKRISLLIPQQRPYVIR